MKNIQKIADEIENDFKSWFGPNGECWCDKLNRFVDPDSCPNKCPECSTLNSEDIRTFRYLHLHDDYRSF